MRASSSAERRLQQKTMTHENAGARTRRCFLWSSPSAHTTPFPRTFATGGLKAGDFTVYSHMSMSMSMSMSHTEIKFVCRGVVRRHSAVHSSEGSNLISTHHSHRYCGKCGEQRHDPSQPPDAGSSPCQYFHDR